MKYYKKTINFQLRLKTEHDDHYNDQEVMITCQ